MAQREIDKHMELNSLFLVKNSCMTSALEADIMLIRFYVLSLALSLSLSLSLCLSLPLYLSVVTNLSCILKCVSVFNVFIFEQL